MTQEYETSIDLYGPDGTDVGSVGEIDVKLTYTVTNWGSPARIHYDENDHPAEGPEIEIVHVGMLTSAFDEYGDPAPSAYIPVWSWLAVLATEWADEHIDELVTDAGEYVQARAEARD